MNIITGRHLSRRTVLKSVGATLWLPFLDAMRPAARLGPAVPQTPVRLICVEMVHGAAGSSEFGIREHLWAPAATGRDFDLRPTSLHPLEPFRDHLTIVSNADVANAAPYEAREIGGDHYRSSAVFLTQEHPKQTEGPDIEAGTSLDQIYARHLGRVTPIPSLQLCIEPTDRSAGFSYGYAPVYLDAISWASPTRPLPMIRDPRVVFDEMFGVFGAGTSPEERRARREEDRSILDWLLGAVARVQRELGARDRARLTDYLDQVREVEQRLQSVEARNAKAELRDLPDAPDGVPDSFAEHVQLMFDLQVLAFSSDITRVVSFKLGRDGSTRTFPDSGFAGPFHPASHHGGREDRIRDFAAINTYHVRVIADALRTLDATPDGDGTLLDNALLLYGSPMGDPNLHNHTRVPFFMAGHAGGAIKGGVHLKAQNGTPLADVMLTVLRSLGMDDVQQFGDSEGAFDLAVPAQTA